MLFRFERESDRLADLHVHSRYSRATSREADLVAYGAWAWVKGVWLVGTGDLLHPAWAKELRAHLVDREEGFWGPVPALARRMKEVARTLVPENGGREWAEPRFVLQTEVATCFRSGGRSHRVHHLILVSSWTGSERLMAALQPYGSLGSDGRPMLALTARELVEAVHEADAGAVVIPAHIWTPWYSALGDRSGFDTLESCYGDAVRAIGAVETGLSADPAMMARVSALDRFQVVSHSDAHSPSLIGREATVFRGVHDYPSLRRALLTGEGLRGTLETFPQAGKYYADGHRRCGVCWMPEETRERQGRCSVCGKPVTRGVLSRVERLADRPSGDKAAPQRSFLRVVSLREVIGERLGRPANHREVQKIWARMLARVGAELPFLAEGDAERTADTVLPGLTERLERVRKGEVRVEPGYDGVFGRVCFDPGP